MLNFKIFFIMLKITIMVKKQSHAATEKSPPGKIAIPMKKLCTTEIIPSAPQNVSTPPSPPRNNLTPPPQ